MEIYRTFYQKVEIYSLALSLISLIPRSLAGDMRSEVGEFSGSG